MSVIEGFHCIAIGLFSQVLYILATQMKNKVEGSWRILHAGSNLPYYLESLQSTYPAISCMYNAPHRLTRPSASALPKDDVASH